ncbi:hypothetical protein JHK85_025853 [Glycine max]|nr:hypothetical protein JHK85_025853 [Glycine max]
MHMEFLAEVSMLDVREQVRDGWRWKTSDSGLYSISEGYKVLQHQSFAGEMDNCSDSIWKMATPSNVKAFTWKALLDRIQSKANYAEELINGW